MELPRMNWIKSPTPPERSEADFLLLHNDGFYQCAMEWDGNVFMECGVLESQDGDDSQVGGFWGMDEIVAWAILPDGLAEAQELKR
jgi:hypothetical protein